MTTDSSAQKGRVPAWATAAFKQMLDQTERLEDVVHLAMRGIGIVQKAHEAVELLALIDGDVTSTDAEERLDRAKRESDLAEREVADGFPVLHSQAVVTLWALLEACVRRLVADWLTNEPTSLQNTPFDKVKVRLAEYERLEKAERMLYVADALEREVAASLQTGVGRFESLLEALRLSGDVPDLLRRELYELSQVRNAIVHRGGSVDRRLAEACPWLSLTPGELVLISHKMFGKYAGAVHAYLILLICRVAERFGVDVSHNRAAVITKYGSAHGLLASGPQETQ